MCEISKTEPQYTAHASSTNGPMVSVFSNELGLHNSNKAMIIQSITFDLQVLHILF